MHNKFSTSLFSDLTEEEIFYRIFHCSIEHEKPVALWKLPSERNIFALVDLEEESALEEIKIENGLSGFAIQAFDENTKPLFLKPSLLFTTEDKNLKIGSNIKDITKIDFFLKNLESFEKINLPGSGKASKGHIVEKKEYLKNIVSAVKDIDSGKFKKVVVARNKSVQNDKNLNLVNVFLNLCQAYPNAFVSLIYHPLHSAWIGASPELLVQLKNNIFKTVALAGTRAADGYHSISEVVWKQKEIEEQALVNRYIINCFKTLRLREYEDVGPKTVQAGNLMHLKTDFKVDLNEIDFPDLATKMLHLLHPTSAVAGMPKKEAIEFIKNHENFARELFAGYLGPVNIQNETHLFVNIRCAKILKDTSFLYAGAGITQDSDPEKEWQETEIKMNTIGKFLLVES